MTEDVKALNKLINDKQLPVIGLTNQPDKK